MPPRTRLTPRILLPVVATAALFVVYLSWCESYAWRDAWERLAETSWDAHDVWQHEINAMRLSQHKVSAALALATVLCTATTLVSMVFVTLSIHIRMEK
jgi:hypothetical protein